MSTESAEAGSASDWSEALAERWQALAGEVRQRLGPGQQLEPGARRFFEGQLGGDLGSVMVHRGPFAGRLAAALGAEAATVQDHVFGDADSLDASDARGAALLGHELSHAGGESMTGAEAASLAGLANGYANPTIQRAPADGAVSTIEQREGENEALLAEAALLDALAEPEIGAAEPPPAMRFTAEVLESLAERVYQRLVDELRRDRERSAW